MAIKLLSILLATVPITFAAKCQGVGCEVEDEVSLLQTKLDVDVAGEAVKNIEETDLLEGEIDDAASVETARDSRPTGGRWFNGIRRERDVKKCDHVLNTKNQDFCIISGGSNPNIEGDRDHFTESSWKDVLDNKQWRGQDNAYHDPLDKDYFFCGVAGIYKGHPEGTVMISGEKQGDDNLKDFCISHGQALTQDSVLVRNREKVALWSTYGCEEREYEGANVCLTGLYDLMFGVENLCHHGQEPKEGFGCLTADQKAEGDLKWAALRVAHRAHDYTHDKTGAPTRPMMGFDSSTPSLADIVKDMFVSVVAKGTPIQFT